MNYRSRLGTDDSDAAAWINLIAGLWLIASPWIYGFAGTTAAGERNSIVVGIVIAVVAALRLVAGRRGVELAWINAVLGAWMIASPFVYGYAGDAPRTANSIIVGIIVLIVALAALPGTAWTGRSSWDTGYPSTPLYPPYGMFGWGYPASPPWTAGERGFRGRGPHGYQRSDADIRNAICERMLDHPGLDATDIDVMVAADGIVTLQGTVESREAKRLAEDIADSVAGVRDVHNQLRLPGPATGRETPRRVA